MRYLKRYNSFNEEAEFDPKVTDAPDIKMSKEKLNTLMNQIKTFKEKKSTIDQIYLKTPDDIQLKKKIGDLLGPEISVKEDRNPFMIEYLNVSDLKRRVEKVKKENVDDKMKLDDFSQDLKSSTDSSQKSAIQQKISDINKRIGLANTTITKIINDINAAEKSLNTRMVKQEKEMKDYIKNISTNKTKTSI